MDAAGVPRPGQPASAVSDARLGHRSPPIPHLSRRTRHVEMPPARPLEDLLAELDALVGLEHVKAEVRRLTSLLRIQKIRAERGLPTIETSHHLVFTGNPGTGKTTVGRLLSQIYRTLGVVSKGHLVETDRSKLVAGYVGQTATRTRQDVGVGARRDAADRRGVRARSRWRERLRARGDRHPREVHGGPPRRPGDRRSPATRRRCRPLLDANPGLESRFTRTIHFPDYTTDELVKIFESMGEKNQYHLDAEAGGRAAGGDRGGTARPRIRQCPLRTQRVRVGRRPSSTATRRHRESHRRAAHDADGSRRRPALIGGGPAELERERGCHRGVVGARLVAHRERVVLDRRQFRLGAKRRDLGQLSARHERIAHEDVVDQLPPATVDAAVGAVRWDSAGRGSTADRRHPDRAGRNPSCRAPILVAREGSVWSPPRLRRSGHRPTHRPAGDPRRQARSVT